jgi:MORN repeat variant
MHKNFILIILILAIGCETKPSKDSSASKGSDSTSTKSKKKKKENGLVKSFHSDGKLFSAINYKDGVKHGVSYAYYPNGQVNLELTYTNGKREGQSKRYYENGKLFQTSEYKNDLLHGWQKKYKEGGSIGSELRFEKDEPCLGLKEYLLDGGVKKNYPTIVITAVDQLATHGKYFLKIAMSDGTKKVKFYEGRLTAGGCLHEGLDFVLLNEKTGVGEISYTLPPGGFLMEELNFVAKVRTLQGNSFITQKAHHLAIEN